MLYKTKTKAIDEKDTAIVYKQSSKLLKKNDIITLPVFLVNIRWIILCNSLQIYYNPIIIYFHVWSSETYK